MRLIKEELHDFWTNLSKEDILESNMKEDERYNTELEAFKTYYKKWECSLCKKDFKTFSRENPCVHSLLRRNDFKKKDFPKIYSGFDYHNISSFLKWVANEERFVGNINNLQSEKYPTKKFEYTINMRRK